jgi:hypothetical protein
MRVAAGTIGLPRFNHRVEDRRAVAVQQPSLDDDPLAASRGAERNRGARRQVEHDLWIRPRGLERRQRATFGHHRISIGVA